MKETIKDILIIGLPTLFFSSIAYLLNNQEHFAVFSSLFGIYFCIGSAFLNRDDINNTDCNLDIEEEWTGLITILNQDLNHDKLTIRQFSIVGCSCEFAVTWLFKRAFE